MLRREKPVDEPLIRPGFLIRDKGFDFIRGGRQPEQIETHTTDQRAAIRLRRGFQTLGREFVADETINRVLVGAGGRRHFRRREIGPVRLVLGALFNPPSEQRLVALGELVQRIRRRHDFAGIFRRDATPDFGLVGPAGSNRGCDAPLGILVGSKGGFGDVEPKIRLVVLHVRTVALEARVRHDRPDVPVELDHLGQGAARLRGRQTRGGEKGKEEAAGSEHLRKTGESRLMRVSDSGGHDQRNVMHR
jgi:hypothetical protein